MKTIGLTVALLILGVMLITPAAFADGDDGGNVFFGFTFGSSGVFYGPPVIYAGPRARVIRPPEEDRDRYRYHRYDRDRRYRGYRGDDDRGHYAHRERTHDHWRHGDDQGDHFRNHFRAHRGDDQGDYQGDYQGEYQGEQ